MTAPALCVSGLAVRRGAALVIHELSLELARGEIVVIQGPNGCGKTTLLESLAGLIPVAAGSVVLDGQQIQGLSPDRIARSGLALVHQDRHLFGSLTVAENVEMAGFMKRPGVAADSAAESLRCFGLDRVAGTPAALVSGGEQQLVTLARGLRCHPTVALLDEPFAALAPSTRGHVAAEIRRRSGEGCAFIIVEHQRDDDAAVVFDRALALRNGVLVRAVTAEEIPA